MATLKYKTENGYVSIPMTVPTKSNEENGNGIGTCDTSSGTALAVTLNGYELVQNGFVAVTFSNNVPANATLNVNGKGAKPIIYKGSAIEADTIKADDTVTFGYDGTNYVVTSLGGSGNIMLHEFVTIHLTSTEGEGDTNLIGATVVVTNDDTSESILSTTWNGSDINLRIDEGIEYTVTVGDVTNYALKNHSQSFIAEGALGRMITFTYIGDAVDLGLPSGLLWAKGNIVKSGGKYIVGAETERGIYVSFGNIIPHISSNGSTWDNGYDWGNYTGNVYNSTPGYNIPAVETTGASFAPNSGYDAAYELLGSKWRMPTKSDFKELMDNTTSTWTTKSGVYGREFTSSINGNKIFMPANGTGEGTGMNWTNSGFYYSSSANGETDESRGAHQFNFSSSSVGDFSYSRFRGCGIRAVQ